MMFLSFNNSHLFLFYMVICCISRVCKLLWFQAQEGNDPDAYAAAVKESADAVQGKGFGWICPSFMHHLAQLPS